MADKKLGEEEKVRKGTVLDHFVEKDEVSHMITALPTLNNDVVTLERIVERFIGQPITAGYTYTCFTLNILYNAQHCF